MTQVFSTCSLLFAALLFTFSIFVSQAEVTCQRNGSDGYCVTSNFCSSEHTLASENTQCSGRSLPLETPSLPGLESCQFDYNIEGYKPCPNSIVTDQTKSVGRYGKPNWVGAEFQSINYEVFSMTVMWEHIDAEVPSPHLNLSYVQGYEIRIIYQDSGGFDVARLCFCVTDPRMRNISNIRSGFLDYRELSHMTVEVRTFPSLYGEDANNRRRNCSLLNRCASRSTTEHCSGDCYSWPQSCLDFLPSYNRLTCAPPLYSQPVNPIAEMTLVNDSVPDSDAGKLDLSWEPPVMNYDLFPVPDTYYVTIESNYSTLNFKVVNSTDISILPLNYTTMYTVYIGAYVPCSGLSNLSNTMNIYNVACGNQLKVIVERSTPPPPPTTTTTTSMPTTTTTWPTSTRIIIVGIAVGVAFFAAVVIIFVLAVLIILRRKHVDTHKTKCNISRLCIPNNIIPIVEAPSKPNTNISVFVFYPREIEREDEAFIQTYLVAALSEHAEIKEIKSPDDPYFERGSIPESIDRNFRESDFVLIVCNSLFLSEWNCDQCSPSVQLLKRYMGNVSIRSDNSISKLITVVLDKQVKELLPHSRLNLGSLRSFMVTESTWESEVEKIVQYMTGTPLFQITTQEHSLDVLEALKSPDSPVSDMVPDSSQESHTATPRTSDSSLSDTNPDHHNNIAYTHDGEVV